MTTDLVPLRRADWRFLLPAPAKGSFEHLVLLGGPGGLGARLQAAGVARRVSERMPDGRDADAVVVLYDASITPTGAARCLAPGGVYYGEVDRRRPGAFARTPARVRRALETAGLRVTGTYWTVPGFDHTRRYLPLESGEALAWYFSTLQTTGSRFAFLADATLRALIGAEWTRLARWVPSFGVTAVAESWPRAAEIDAPSVLGHGAALPLARRPGTRVALLTSGQDDGSRVVLLPFEPGRAEPSVVVKATRSPVFNGNTEREQHTLRRLRSQLDPAMSATIPEPLGTYRYGELLVGVESCAPGPAVVVSSGRWKASLVAARDDLRLATEWLTRFHEQARCAVGRWDGGLAARVEARLTDYRRLGPTAAEARLIAYALERSKTLADAIVPTVWLHNDFGPWNIHRAGARVTVIDWEFGGEDERDRVGPPLCDLLYFATYWHHRVRHFRGDAAELRGIRELFLEQSGGHAAAQAARAAVDAYMARLALDARIHPLLLVYTWVDRALDRASRGQLAGRGAHEPNRYREYVQLLATRAEQLFASTEGR